MDTTELIFRELCDGRTSLNDIRDLLIGTGHSQERFNAVLDGLLDDDRLRAEVKNHQVFLVPA
jgi:hypothetical protein